MLTEDEIKKYLKADFDTILEYSDIKTEIDRSGKMHGYIYYKITSRHYPTLRFRREVSEWVLKEEGLV